MVKLLVVISIMASSSLFASHKFDKKVHDINSLTPTEEIQILKGTESTKLGEKCLLIHQKFENNVVLTSQAPLVVEDIFSKVEENDHGVISGYMKYSVGVTILNIPGVTGLTCEAGSIENTEGTYVYSDGEVDSFTYEYTTTFDDLKTAFQGYLSIKSGERASRPILKVSGTSRHFFATQKQHAYSAKKRFSKNADKECQSLNYSTWRKLSSRWGKRLNIEKHALTGRIKCLK
jgi:hypothetical protein